MKKESILEKNLITSLILHRFWILTTHFTRKKMYFLNMNENVSIFLQKMALNDTDCNV